MFTYIIIGLVLAMIVAGAYIALRMNTNVRRNEDLIEQARQRALERSSTKQFADTTPAVDPYVTSVELSEAMAAIFVHEHAGGPNTLSDEQKRIISTIFDGKPIIPENISTAPDTDDIWGNRK